MLRSVVENIPGICQLKPEQEECLVHILNGGDFVSLLPTDFGKSLIYQLLPIVSEKLWRPKSGKVIIVIVLHSLACTMIEGNFILIFSSPNPGFSIQNGELCWHQPYTKTTSSSLSLTRHMSHTNGEFAYKGLVINFNKLIYFDISSVQQCHLLTFIASSRRLSRRITYVITKCYMIGLQLQQ